MARAQWEAVAREEAAKYGLDPDVVTRLITQESQWKPDAGSPKGARGLMQITPITAKDMGAKEVPMDPIENIRMGVGYLAKMYKRFDGDLHKTLAAYNWGPGNLSRLGLTKAPKETRDYLDIILGKGAWSQATGAQASAPAQPAPAPAPIASIPAQGNNMPTRNNAMNPVDRIAAEMFDAPAPGEAAPAGDDPAAQIYGEMFGAPAAPVAEPAAPEPGPATPGARDGQEISARPLSMQDVLDESPVGQAMEGFERSVTNAPFNIGRATTGLVGADDAQTKIKEWQDQYNEWRDKNIGIPRGTTAERVGGVVGDVVTGLATGGAAGAGIQTLGKGLGAVAPYLSKLPGAGRYIAEFLKMAESGFKSFGGSVASGGVANPAQSVGKSIMFRGADLGKRMGAGSLNAMAGGAAIDPTSNPLANGVMGALPPFVGAVGRNALEPVRNRFIFTGDHGASDVLKSAVGPKMDMRSIRGALHGAEPEGTIAQRMPFEKLSDELAAQGNSVGGRRVDDLAMHLGTRDEGARALLADKTAEQEAARWAALHGAGSANPSAVKAKRPDVPTLADDVTTPPPPDDIPKGVDDTLLGKLDDDALELPGSAADDIPGATVANQGAGARDTISQALSDRAKVYGLMLPDMKASLGIRVDPDDLRNFLRGPGTQGSRLGWHDDSLGALKDMDDVLRRGEKGTFAPPVAVHPNGDPVTVPAEVVREVQAKAREIRSGTHNKSKGILSKPGQRMEDASRMGKDIAADVLDTASPVFREADEAFAAMSQPVDSARVMTLLGDAVRKSASDGVPASEAVLKRLDKVMNDPEAARRLQPEARALLERLRNELKPQVRRRTQSTGLLSPEQHARLRPKIGSTSGTLLASDLGGQAINMARHAADFILGTNKKATKVREALARALMDDPAYLNELLTMSERARLGTGLPGKATAHASRRAPNLIPSVNATATREEEALERKQRREDAK